MKKWRIRELKYSYFRIFLTCFAIVALLFVIAKAIPTFVSEQNVESDIQSGAFLDVVRDTKSRAETWLFKSQAENGLFVYSFSPKNGEYSTQNNELRQLMGSRVVSEQSHNNPNALLLHEKNLAFMFKYWYKEDGNIAYIFYDEKSKLGANAMLLRTLVYSPKFEEYGKEAEKVARGILSLQNADGSFRPWLIEPDYEYDPAYLMTFYSGEAILALVEYGERSGKKEFTDAAKLASDFYLQKYVAELEENYYPAYVPWHTLAYSKLYKITGEQKYADAIFTLNDKLLELLDTANHKGRFFNPLTPQYGTPHSASDGVYTEGLAYAYEVALLEDDTVRAKRYRDALDLAVRNLASLQYRAPLSGSPLQFEVYNGAIRTSTDSAWARIDNAQHSIDAFTKILEVVRE